MIISKEAAGRVRSNALFAAWLLLTDRVLVEQAQAGTRIEWTVEPVFGYHKRGEVTSNPNRGLEILSGVKKEKQSQVIRMCAALIERLAKTG